MGMLRITWLHEGREGQVDLLNSSIFSEIEREEYEHESWISGQIYRSYCTLSRRNGSLVLNYSVTDGAKQNRRNRIDRGALVISGDLKKPETLRTTWETGDSILIHKPQPLIEMLHPST
jgi:hypothetical protein